MLGIRGKLSLGFGGLFLIIMVIGVQSIRQLYLLENLIDVILRENYRSVVACQQMKEAIERMDSGALFILLGENEQGKELVSQNGPVFSRAMQAELNNVTLPGEAERAERIRDNFARYQDILKDVQDLQLPVENRREVYFSKLLPVFYRIKATAEEVLQMNQRNMADAEAVARTTAGAAQRNMVILLFFGAAVAILFILFTGRWILKPINRLIRSTDEIRRGNLDLVVQSESRDEIGRLSEAFNAMASSLRQFRRTNRTRMARIQRSTQQVFDSLPDAVAVVDLDGRIEVSTPSAAEIFGLRPEVRIRTLPFDWMGGLFDEALKSGRMVESQGSRGVFQRFIKGEEHFFNPTAVSILDSERHPTGIILTLEDVTRELHQDELKKGVISTVSHQLKTPLTSLRMVVYLLLEEKAGPLTPKQAELLLAARDESDRLHSILGNLLDISRIESGRMRMDLKPVAPAGIIAEQVDSFRSAAKDRGITLDAKIPDDLPEVTADADRIGHVLANLLSNAVKYTSAGGSVTVSAQARDDEVCVEVSDTGRGIPARYVDRVFEQFFRVPGQEGENGEGLGLAIAKEIVEAHGGVIGVKSSEGKGSVFTFCLKRADRAPREGSIR